MAPHPTLSPRCRTGNVKGAGRGIQGEGPCFFHTLRKFLHRVRMSVLVVPGPFLVLPLPAATMVLTPSADTALLENYPSNNFGGQTWLNAGTTQNYTKNRALMKFNMAGSIPPGAKITAVSLTVQVTHSPVDGDTSSTFELHRVLRDWGEGDKSGQPPTLGAPATAGEANWTHRFALTTNAWAEPGGAPGIDYLQASSSEQFIYGENFSPYTFASTTDLVADVQCWLDRPELNF